MEVSEEVFFENSLNFTSLVAFNLLGRHLVMLSGLETGDSWRKLIGLCCIEARFPNTTSHPIPDTPRHIVLSNVYQRLWSQEIYL